MKRIECNFCRRTIFDRCEWYYEVSRKCQNNGNKEKVHICSRCAQALLDVVSDKRKEYDAEPVCGED